MIDSKNIKKKGLGKRQISIIICASVLVLLIAGYAVISTLISAGVIGGTGENTGSSVTAPTDIRDGEGTLNNRHTAYPYVKTNQIISVAVKSHADNFMMKRPNAEKEDGTLDEDKYESYFIFYYEDENGDLKAYYPDILSEEPDTQYTDFYAIENSDGLNATKLEYLCAAIGALYFEERIEPEDGGKLSIEQYNRYGLTADKRETIYIDYLDSEGKKQTHTVFVGDKLITGRGYYYMIEGREYIYSAPSGDNLSYLLGEFESFLGSRIVAEGLPQDSLYEPYLTTEYTQWTNKYYSMNNGGLGKSVAEGSEVVIFANLYEPMYSSNGNTNDDGGYKKSGYKVDLVDLSFVANRPEFARMKALLLANTVGSYEDNEIVATVVTNINQAQLDKTYKYAITGIESVLTDTEEFIEAGHPVGDASLVKVSYYASVDGKEISDEICHAVLDLNDPLIPDDVKTSLREAKVGDSLSLSYEIVYTEENSTLRNMQTVITEINLIMGAGENGQIIYPDKVAEDSLVTYTYKIMVDGYELKGETRTSIDLSAVTEGGALLIKNALLGKEVSTGLELKTVEDKLYCQSFADFVTYNIKEIRGFVQKEKIVSFEFVNASQRDPFYGESIYKHKNESDANSLYALDSVACQNVTFLLGGVGSGQNSQRSEGLVGTETVAVGLTPAIMDTYGLYDGYTIYFELPRGISVVGGAADNELDDYRHLSTLGFTLYISHKQSDGTRFVASTMYDIVVKIDGDKFDYLERSFEEYWARRNLVLVDYKLIENVDIEIGMNDIFGKYSFTVDHKTVFIKNDEILPERPEDGTGTEYEWLDINVKPTSGEISDSLFADILKNEGRESINLANVYNRALGGEYYIGYDTAGAANYKEFLRLIYGVYYTGTMTEAEQEEAVANSPKILSIAFKILDPRSDSYDYYSYDFYRASDRRVMVHLYRCDSDGTPIFGTEHEASGFYISTFAAKKIINSVVSMLNGENIDVNATYWSKN